MKIFGERVKILREEKGITQKQLADAIGYGKSTISFWENDLKDASCEAIAKIAKYFKVPSDYLLGLDD